MRKLWRPLVIIFVVGFMAADVYLDSLNARTEAPPPAADPNLAVGLAEGELAPDLSGVTLEGEEIRLSDLRGQVVLVNIFASWCAPCRLEAPHLVEVHRKYEAADEEFAFIGLNLQEDVAAIEAFKSEFGIDFPLVLNEDGALTEIYRPIGLPTSWFIDETGVIRYVHAGPITQEVLEGALEDLKAGLEPDPFRS
ncbi:MAG: TlpA disulfide reductase family protein [Anaerolineales bacterium]|nr:TlpA disulfide reductase family protein [Anaerolineales bacterium]